MPSAFESMFAEGADVLHRQVFGELGIYVWPLAVEADAFEIEDGAEWEIEQPTESPTGGRHQQLRGRLRVPHTITIGKRDAVVIDGRMYTVSTIGVETGDGSYEVVLEAVVGDWRKGARERL